MKNLMVVCNNDTHWNLACNMIEHVLEFCHYINIFCTINQRLVKQNQDKNDDNRSVCQDTLTLGNWDTLKELYNLKKPCQDFTACMEGHAKMGLYGALWELMPVIELLVSKYKQFSEQYIALAISVKDFDIKNLADIEYSHILLCTNNAFYKLMKYQKLLS